MIVLNNDQQDKLVEQFVELQVDNMDTKTMMEWITDELIFQYGKLSNEELKERVDCYDDELFDDTFDDPGRLQSYLVEHFKRCTTSQQKKFHFTLAPLLRFHMLREFIRPLPTVTNLLP